MPTFLCPHEKCLTGSVIPTACFLFQFFANFESSDLPFDFICERTANPTDRVHVLDFDLGPELPLCFRPHRHVAVTAQLSLFHVGIADPSVNQDLFERGKKSE